MPVLHLNEGDEHWNIQKDLLGSDRLTPEFVAEIEETELSGYVSEIISREKNLIRGQSTGNVPYREWPSGQCWPRYNYTHCLQHKQ